MEFNKKEWTGNWVNFEKYIYSAEAAMQQCWAEAEKKAMPMFKREFLENGLQFITRRLPVRLGGWKVSDSRDGVKSNGWMQKAQAYGLTFMHAGRLVWRAENYLFQEVSAHWPFRYGAVWNQRTRQSPRFSSQSFSFPVCQQPEEPSEGRY